MATAVPIAFGLADYRRVPGVTGPSLPRDQRGGSRSVSEDTRSATPKSAKQIIDIERVESPTRTQGGRGVVR